MTKRTSLIVLFVLSVLCSFGQNQAVYFFKNSGRQVAVRDSADFIRVVSLPDSGSILYNVREFYSNGKPKLTGKSKFATFLSLDGPCITYYPNGKKKSILRYHKGTLASLQQFVYPNGKLYQTLAYPDSLAANSTQEMIPYRIVNAADSLGKPLVAESGNGYYLGYDDSFKYVLEEGYVKNGLRDSIWKGKDDKLEVTFIEKYSAGKLLEGEAVDRAGVIAKYAKQRVTELKYKKGGFDGFQRYMGTNLRFPRSYMNSRGEWLYSVRLSFTLNPDNTMSNFVVLSSGGKELDDAAIVLCKKTASNWSVGEMYGRKVPMQFTMEPIVLTGYIETRSTTHR